MKNITIWQSLEKYRNTLIWVIVGLLFSQFLLLAFLSKAMKKPVYVVYADTQGNNTLLLKDAQFQSPKWHEVQQYTKNFLIAYMGLDSKKIRERLPIALSMMSNQLIKQHKQTYQDEDFMRSVEKMNVANILYFESIILTEQNKDQLYINIEGRIHTHQYKSDQNNSHTLKNIAEKRFHSKLRLNLIERSKSNIQGLQVDQFHFESFDNNQYSTIIKP